MTDLELCRFLDLGYHVINPHEIPEATHDGLFDMATELHRQRAGISDPLVSLDVIADTLDVRVPLLNDVLNCAALDSALTAVLGERYFRYNHSFIHLSGEYDQSYHKDSVLPWGTRSGVRSHRPNWAMAFYYPQAVTIDMGATEILPGTQYWNVDREGTGRTEGEDRLDANFHQGSMNAMSTTERDRYLQAQVPTFDRHVEPLRLELPKGALVLVHFDLFHRGTRRVREDLRYMYKFWYVRTTAPRVSAPKRTISYGAIDPRRQSMIEKHAAWLGLKIEPPESSATAEGGDQDADRLLRTHVQVETNASSIVEDLTSGIESKRRNAMYALVGKDEFAAPAAFDLLRLERAQDRRSGAFLLGELDTPSERCIESLLHYSTKDPNIDVRMAATNAIGRALRARIGSGCIDMPSKLTRAWSEALANAEEQTTHFGLVQSAERQCIYVALLNIVSSFIVNNAEPDEGVLDAMANLVLPRLGGESDRYAKNTALEVVERLAEMRNRKANSGTFRARVVDGHRGAASTNA